MKRARAKAPTPAEDAAINRGIATDPDNPELPADFGARALPLDQVFPPEMLAAVPRRRGPGKKPAKVVVSLRLAPDVVAKLRALGPGWQVTAVEALTAMAQGGTTPTARGSRRRGSAQG